MRLRRHAYDRFLGPQFKQMAPVLKDSGREILRFWDAVGEASQWLCRVLQAARERNWIRYDANSASWHAHRKFEGTLFHLDHKLRRGHAQF